MNFSRSACRIGAVGSTKGAEPSGKGRRGRDLMQVAAWCGGEGDLRAAGTEGSPPFRLRWLDAVSGEIVWMELEGPREFVADLVAHGFEATGALDASGA